MDINHGYILSSSSSESDLQPQSEFQDGKVRFNVSGTRYETFVTSVLHSKQVIPRLVNKKFMRRHWDEKNDEYFFDRDADAFSVIIDYMRTGHLHIPKDMCSPYIIMELEYWGLPMIDLEPCCWKGYSFGIQNIKNLRKLEKDCRPAYAQSGPTYSTRTCMIMIWENLTEPDTSLVAKVFSILSFITVLISQMIFLLQSVDYKTIKYLMSNTKLSYNETISEALINSTEFKEAKFTWCDTLCHMDFLCVLVFSFEFWTVLVCCPDKRTLLKEILFWVDLIALAADYITLITNGLPICSHCNVGKFDDSAGLGRFTQNVRLFRVFRMLRRAPGVWIMLYTLRMSVKELMLIFGIQCLFTFVFASSMYFIDEPHPFGSIPANCYWAIITLTGTGYGDMVPTSPAGQFLAASAAILGHFTLSLTIPTLINNFLGMYHNIKYMLFKEMLFKEKQFLDKCKGSTHVDKQLAAKIKNLAKGKNCMGTSPDRVARLGRKDGTQSLSEAMEGEPISTTSELKDYQVRDSVILNLVQPSPTTSQI